MDVKGKALFLILLSSGMRIGECLKLKLDDVDLDREYSVENEVITVPTIEIQGEYTKTGNPRVTFISNETKEIINEWFKIREKYIKTATKRSTLH
nr:tyrosine-type recombinase/integrase [Nitrososphaeria archaeon]NIN53610.1 tyrosine-type recombinase/integrase [Nitrososphaeria archaeon]NIQ34131.1 tyrosine-type recombinase/integrase [Nitrososphaeria archaeon]